MGGRSAAASAVRPGRSAREIAVDILVRVEQTGAYANLLLRDTLTRAAPSPADAALATELVFGTLRHRLRVDRALQAALSHALADLPPAIRAILRTAAYQLICLRGIPPHAAVHEAVELARSRGHAGTVRLTNAVLRRIAAEGEPPLPDPAGDPVAALAVEHSHPDWLVARWLERWGPEQTAALCRANNLPAPATIRVNILRDGPTALAGQLAAAGLRVAPTALPEGLAVVGPFDDRHRLIEAGLATPQDLGAMLVVHALDPQPGEMIIDACAAPGGKSTHIAERMANTGRLIACDIHPAKVEAVRRRALAMGIANLTARVQDARTLGRTFAGQADRVLIDAPCTGLGVVRRRPEIKWRVRPEMLGALAGRQAAILAGAAGAVRPGGVLVYSVCSTEPEEGAAVVQRFLDDHPEFSPEAFPWPEGLAAPCADVAGTGMVLPHLHGTDGYFIARLRRREARP